jgi:hypothetical protein
LEMFSRLISANYLVSKMSSLKVYLILFSSIYFVLCESPSEELLKIPVEDVSDPGTGLRDEKYRWPKIRGSVNVPYDFGNFFSENQLKTILLAMRTMETETNCIKFVRRTDQQDYVYFEKNDWACNSFVGRRGGAQAINLMTSCVEAGSIQHELTHALGFFHQQNHPNRDQYVTIKSSNIAFDVEYSFRILDAIEGTSFNTPYDFDSIMHYPSNAFAYAGTYTIVRKDGVNGGRIAENKKLSVGDITRIRRMYKCEELTDKDDVAETTEGPETREIVTKQIITTTIETTEDPKIFETSEIPETVTEEITTTTSEFTKQNEKEDRDLKIYLIITNAAFIIAVVASFAIVYFHVVPLLIRDSHKIVKIFFSKSRGGDDDDRVLLVIS